MSVLKSFAPIASAALLLAAAGCTMERKDGTDTAAPAAAAVTVVEPAGGHEIHVMFDAQKRSAQAAELPAQF